MKSHFKLTAPDDLMAQLILHGSIGEFRKLRDALSVVGTKVLNGHITRLIAQINEVIEMADQTFTEAPKSPVGD